MEFGDKILTSKTDFKNNNNILINNGYCKKITGRSAPNC